MAAVERIPSADAVMQACLAQDPRYFFASTMSSPAIDRLA
jgi:hypothetical protein